MDNFPVARTRKPDEIAETLSRIYAKPTVELGRGVKTLDAHINECGLRSVRLAYGSYGGALRFRYPAADRFIQIMPLRGRGEVTSGGQWVSLTSGSDSATVSPDAGHVGSYSDDFECLVLKLDPQTLTKKLVAMTGTPIDQPLQMDLHDNRSQSAQTLRSYVRALVDVLSEATPPLPDWWIGQTEQLLMVMFLCGHRHNYSHLLEREAPDPAPWQVRRAEDYIEANWRETITVEDLAKVTGVSAFSLFRTFRKTRGYSPLDFASQVRSKRSGRS